MRISRRCTGATELRLHGARNGRAFEDHLYVPSKLSSSVKLTYNEAPKMLVAPAGFIYYDYTKIFPKLDEKVKTIEKYIVLEDLNGKYEMSIDKPNYVAYEKYLQQYKPNASGLPKVDISPHDMVNVQFTSGSTGLPKNVALSHYNIMVLPPETPMAWRLADME
jgi:acyl-CoA synthetase (AMP-forming)/AMP-acid ligase II